MGQVIGGRPVTGAQPRPGAVSVSPDRDIQRLSVSQATPRTPQPALSPDRDVYPAPAVLPASGLVPYSAMVPVPLDSGMRDHDYEPGERRRAVIPRATGTVTAEMMLSNTAYELAELRSRDRAVSGRPAPDRKRPAVAADQDEAARHLSDAWTRVPSPEQALALLSDLRSDTGDRRAVEAARTIEAMLSARQRAQQSGELRCRFCHAKIERHTIKGPPPEFCSRSCESRAFRQRKREAQAAEAKPVPVTGDAETWDSRDADSHG
jgi:hypothetical protein